MYHENVFIRKPYGYPGMKEDVKVKDAPAGFRAPASEYTEGEAVPGCHIPKHVSVKSEGGLASINFVVILIMNKNI